MDIAAARARLEEQLARLQDDAQAIDAANSAADLHVAHLSQHPADYGTELSDAEREDAIRGSVEREISQVKRALRLIDTGGYGRCVECGRVIPSERLEARPEAIRCLEHQERYEASLS